MRRRTLAFAQGIAMVAAAAVLVGAGLLLRPLPQGGSLSRPVKVAPGSAYTRHGRTVRPGKVELVPIVSNGHSLIIQVPLTLTSDSHWQISPSDVSLRLSDGTEVSALPPDRDEPDTSLVFGPGIERTAVLRFRAPGKLGLADRLELRLQDPNARFTLETG